jgi:hypothetical protein
VLADGLFLLEILVFQQEFGGLRNGDWVFVLEFGGFGLERPVFLLSDGVFPLPDSVACRKSPFSCRKPRRASRKSQRSCSPAAIAISLLKKCLTQGRDAGTLGAGNKSPTPCQIGINRACSTMRRRQLQKANVWLKSNSKSTT